MSRNQKAEQLSEQSVWLLDRIKDHALKIGSGVTPTGGATSYLDAGIPLLRSQNVHFDGLWLDDVAYIAGDVHNEMSGSKLQPGDVLLNITGASIGRCTFVPEEFGEGNVNQHVCIIRPSAKLDYKYLTYCLSAPWGQDQIFSSFTGASRQGLGQRDLGNIRIPLPSLAEQHLIADFLDASCKAIDTAIAAKRKQLETLDALRKATIQRIVTRGLVENSLLRKTGNIWLNEIPANWGLVMLKRVCYIQTGLTLGKTYEGTVIERPYLRVANVQDGHLALDEITLIEVPPLVAERVTLRSGDVLMTEGGDLDKLGRGYVWNGEIDGCLHQNHIFAVRCFPHKLLPKFLAYVTTSQLGRDYFEATGKRTTNLAATNGTKVGAMPVPLPSLDEQNILIEYLDAQIERFKKIQTIIQNQISTLTAYRKSLIHECVTGQRRISEEDVSRVKSMNN